MFMKRYFCLCIGFLILSQMRISVGVHNCHHKITRPPLYGYRCVTETEEYISLTNIQQHLCTHQCMQRYDCRIINYNTRQRTCFLSQDGCVQLQRDGSFQVNVLGTISRSECLQWQSPPPSGSGDFSVVQSDMCHQSQVCSVGRLKVGNFILPGKYLHSSGVLFQVLNGAEVGNGVKEILTVHHECQVVWMPFTASNTLPVGAIAGGHLDGGSALYSARARAGRTLTPLGFYYPFVTALGYLPYNGVHEITVMEILVLLRISGQIL